MACATIATTQSSSEPLVLSKVSGGNPQSARILIVEDDPRSARMVSAHLQSAGYRVDIANLASEAQQKAETALPDLILCDVCLPDMDGIQLTSWMRQRFADANLPIALITSSDDSKILSRGLEAGADDFLAKPVNSLELRSRVRSLLRSKFMGDELRARQRASVPSSDQDASASSSRDGERKDQTPCVVVIEDSPQERRLMQAQLTELKCETRGAETAEAGMALIRECSPDLIVLDLLLPTCHGYEFIATLKKDRDCMHVPILVVSALSEVEDRVKALELGADDYITKGFERVEFEARVRRLLRLKDSLDKLNSRCNQALQKAVTDDLTGLFTAGFMRETLQSQLSYARRSEEPFSLIFGDIDHFKQVNDCHGHAAGDAVLRSVATAISQVARQSDTVARNGGEEFVVLLPHTNRAGAVLFAERMREAVAAIETQVGDGQPIKVTMSLGVATFPEDAADGESLLERGDVAMYLAKRAGRNRVIAAGAASKFIGIPTARPAGNTKN